MECIVKNQGLKDRTFLHLQMTSHSEVSQLGQTDIRLTFQLSADYS